MPSKILFLIFLLLFGGTSFAAAQSCDGQPAASRDKDKSVKVEYDSASDETAVQLPLMTIPQADRDLQADKLAVKAGFVYKGRNLSEAPKTILLEVFTNSRGDGLFVKEEARSLSIKVDDKLLLFGIFRLFSARTGIFMNQMNKWKTEHLGMEIPLAAFARMVGGGKVVFEIGGRKISVRDEKLKSFCQLLSHTQPVN